MLKLSDSHHFRKTVAGACMILAPLLALVAMIVHPGREADAGAVVSSAVASPDAWYASHLMAFVAVMLAIPMVFGLMHLVRERGAGYGHIGGGLALIGLVALAGMAAIGFVVWQMAAGGDTAQMTALLERVYEADGVVIPLFVLSLGFGLGLFILALGMYRARVVQSYTAAFIAVGAVVMQAGLIAASDVLAIVGAAVLFVGSFVTGRMVLEETDAEWEHTPEHGGFRPLAGMR